MMLYIHNLALLATLLTVPFSTLCGAEVADIPSDTPISSLVASAKAARAQGQNNDALIYWDAAIKRDSSDYLTIFQRGATYLSLGRNSQAQADFDSVLKIRPGFEGALIQRAKIHARNAQWEAAKADYKLVGAKSEQDLKDLEEAQGAAYLAVEAEQRKDWEECVNNAGLAIMTAGTALSLRQLRAKCRFERGEIHEGISDLAHVLQIHPGAVEPHMQISSMHFYSLGDTERGLTQIRKCLHSDPDSKPCKKLFREEKGILKIAQRVKSLIEKRQYNAAVKLLVGTGQDDDAGLLTELRENISAGRKTGMIHANAGSDLYDRHVELACECYHSMNSHKKAAIYCDEALKVNPMALYALLHKAKIELDNENYEAAISTLSTAKDHHPESRDVQQKLQEAHTLLKRSKSKDYYKILGVSKDADDRTIKKAYRTASKTYHPDKAMAKGITKEDAERKMAGINEAYEVLSDPELRAKFDHGEDPNDPMSRQGGNPFQGSPFGGGQQQFFFQQGGQQFKFSGGFPFGG